MQSPQCIIGNLWLLSEGKSLYVVRMATGRFVKLQSITTNIRDYEQQYGLNCLKIIKV